MKLPLINRTKSEPTVLGVIRDRPASLLFNHISLGGRLAIILAKFAAG